jgi:hypothetical protein
MIIVFKHKKNNYLQNLFFPLGSSRILFLSAFPATHTKIQKIFSHEFIYKLTQNKPVNQTKKNKTAAMASYLLKEVPCSYNRAANKTDNIMGGEAVVNKIIITIRSTLCEVQMERNVWNSGWYQGTYYWAAT